MHFSRALILILAALTAAAGAQTPIGGVISDGNGGPLLTGVVYHATSTVSVAAGTTLTIQPGAIVKFGSSLRLQVQGTLDIQGTAGQPVILTEIADDTAGGDTNGDGPSTGTPGTWRSLRFDAGSTSTVSGLDLRFAGRFGEAGIEIFGGTVTLLSSCVTDCGTSPCLDLNATPATVNIAGCDFTDSGRAVAGVPLESLPGFDGNTASGNAVHDTLELNPTTLTSGTTTILPQNMISNVVLAGSGVNIQAGATLVFEAGCILKFSVTGHRIEADGDLICNGVAGNPVIVTSILDDAHGGDTNKDGAATLPTPGYFRSMRFNASSSASHVKHTELWYGGRFGEAALEIFGAPVTIESCTVHAAQASGLDLNDTHADVDVTACHFTGGNRAVDGVPLTAVPGFHNNTASGNTAHDSLALSSATIASGTTTILPENMISNVFLCGINVNVDPGATLVFEAGTILKWSNSGLSINVSGTFTCNGVAGNPVVFTDIKDDTWGGDTNLSPTPAAPGWWRGFNFLAGSSGSALTHALVLYAGRFSEPALDVQDDITLRSCTIDQAQADAIDLQGSMAQPTIEDCTITNCGGHGFDGLRWRSVKNFANNTLTGNAANYARLNVAQVGADAHVFAHALPEGVVVLTVVPLFDAASSLILEGGVVVKVASTSAFDVGAGTFEVRGTGPRPVVFTSFEDDAWGGDTNQSAIAPVPGAWRGIHMQPGAAPSKLDHLVVRYAGRFGEHSLELDNSGTAVNAVRVDHGQAIGVRALDMAGDANNWIVHGCGNDGIQLDGGTFDVLHATVQGCGGFGIQNTASGWSGTIFNTISWNNAAGNYDGIANGTLMSSNGSAVLAGMNGNIDTDPMFVDPSNDDLELQAGSPCIDVADFSTADALREDHREGSRLSDDDLSGDVLPDMGALERFTWHLSVENDPRIGTQQLYTITGPPNGGGALVVAGANQNEYFYPDYGWMLIGHESEVFLVTLMTPGVPFAVSFPDVPAIVGVPFRVQAITVSFANTTRGNWSERYRATITD